MSFVKEDKYTIEIEGVCYAKGVFKAWGCNGLDVGTWFKLVSRENGTITIQTLRDENVYIQKLEAVAKAAEGSLKTGCASAHYSLREVLAALQEPGEGGRSEKAVKL